MNRGLLVFTDKIITSLTCEHYPVIARGNSIDSVLIKNKSNMAKHADRMPNPESV